LDKRLEDIRRKDKGTAEYRTGGLQKIGQEGGRIEARKVTEYWTRGQQHIEREVGRIPGSKILSRRISEYMTKGSILGRG
jgi:hypothetical protein